MQGLDQILGSNGTDIGQLAARFGISPDQASAALGSLMPAVAGGMQRRADTGDLAPVEQVGSQIDQPSTSAGNDILGHIFGSKDVSRQVADHAAGQSGLSSTVMKAMLPVVAAMVAKHLAQNSGGGAMAQGGADGGLGGGLGGMLGSVLGGGQAGGSQSGGVGGLLGGLLGGGGNPLDAILGGRR
jgi:hypothetical protein